MEDELELLYNTVKDRKLYSKSLDEFKIKYSDPKQQEFLYGVVKDKKLYSKTLDEFKGKYFSTNGEDVKKKEAQETSLSPYLTGEGLSDLAGTEKPETFEEEKEDPPPKSEDIPVQDVDQPIADLYKQYEESTAVTAKNVADIESKLQDQEEGERGFWETAIAVTEGFLKTGVFIPLFQYDNREALIAAREQQNKVNFLEALPPEKVEDLRLFAGEKITDLDRENMNVVAENSMMMERAKEMANELKYHKEAIITLRENNQPVPPEALESFNNLYSKFNDLNVKHNSNIDILEANTEDIGNFYEEVNLLKKNYGGLDYYQDIARLASADIMAGTAQLSMDISEGVSEVTGIPAPVKMLFDSNDIKDFRHEVTEQREDIKPLMSVMDIGGDTYKEVLSSFGGWLAEQTASQLPIITVLAASGGQAGLGLLGAGAAGQKMGELKDERDEAQELISEYSKILQDPDLPQDQRLDIEAEIKRNERTAGVTDNEAFMAGVAVGSFEILSERITLGILSKGRRSIVAGYKAGKADVRRGIKDYIQNSAGINALSEGGSEFLNQIGQNMVDMLYLGNPDVHVFDGAVDALASGTAMGVGMTKIPQAIGFGLSTFVKADKSKEVAEDSNKVADLLGEMENENIDPAVKKMLKKKATKLARKVKKDIADTYGKVEGMPKAEIQELIDIQKNAQELGQRVRLLQDSPMSSESLHNELLEEMSVEAEKLRTKKAEILDKYEKVKPKKAEAVRAKADKTGEGKPEVQEAPGKKPGVAPDVTGVKPVTQTIKELTAQKKTLETAKAKEKGWTPKKEKLLAQVDQAIENAVARKVAAKPTKPIPKRKAVPKDLKDIDLSTKLGLKEAEVFLANKKAELDKFGEETLGVGMPVVVARGAITAMQGAVKAGKLAADVISAGLNHVRSTDWYKKLTTREQRKFERRFIKRANKATPIQRTTPTKDDLKTTVKKLLSGFPILTYIDEKTFTKWSNSLERFITKKVQEGTVHRNKLKRVISQGLTAWFNGLPRTDKQLAQKRIVSGRQDVAFVTGKKMFNALGGLINFDAESARRVHSVMDPELYRLKDMVLEEELTDSEKALLEELRKINNKTHETNYALGLISQETYEKFKGNYLGRGYEIYEKTLEDFERPIAKENKLMTKIFKQRQDIEEWHVDNAIQDPIYLTVNRMIQTERNAAVLAYSHFVAKQPGVISEEARPGFTKLQGKAYGKLQGKYVVNYVAEDFKGYFYTNYIADRAYSAIKYYDKLKARQFVKKYHTVWSPVVQFGNLMSNNAFAFGAGLNIAQFWYQGPSALKDIKNKSGDYLVLLENGIIGTNVLTADISLSKAKQDQLQVGAYKKTKSYLNKLDKKAQEIYAGADDLSKIAAYKALKAAGYTQDQAIQRVFEGFQNYASVGKIWDFAAKTPVWGNAYIKFQADLQRIIKNAATKRPLTTAAFLGMLRAGAIVLSEAFGEEEEERDIRESRAFIPKINLGVTDIPLVFKIGKEKELNIARFISPYYEYDIPTKSFLEKATRWAPFQYREYETAAMGEFAGSLETSDVLLGPWWAAFINNRDFRQKTITDPNATRYKPSGKTTLEKTFNRFNYIARSQVPLWNTVNDAILSAKYGKDYFGRDKDYLDLIISKVAKVQTFNDESLKRELMSRYRTIDFEQKAINAKMTAAKNRTIKEVNAVHKRVSEGEITEARGAEIIKRRSEEGFKRWNVHFEALAKEQSKLNKLIEDTRPIMDRLQ